MPRTVISIVGARPQFIKAAAVSRVLAREALLREVMVHTGQHFDGNMSKIFFDELSIPAPAYALGISGGNHGLMTGRMLEAIEKVLVHEDPEIVVIYGDTNSTLAGALAAAKLQIPVAHVEAGLRSFNRAMPEEINRVVSDHVSDLLLCPTRTAVKNLRNEGITHGIHHTGDVMHDAALYARARAREASRILERLELRDKGYVVATVHRAENTDDPESLGHVLDYLKERARESPVVLPLHPRTRQAAARFGLDFDGITVCEPVGYLDMACLLDGAEAVCTDSGGLQKEAYFYRVPCITLRDETEWVETVEAGWNRLWTIPGYAARKEINEYGDGQSAYYIVDLLRSYVCR